MDSNSPATIAYREYRRAIRANARDAARARRKDRTAHARARRDDTAYDRGYRQALRDVRKA